MNLYFKISLDNSDKSGPSKILLRNVDLWNLLIASYKLNQIIQVWFIFLDFHFKNLIFFLDFLELLNSIFGM